MTSTVDPAHLTEPTGDYTLDPVYIRIGFSTRHAMVTKVREPSASSMEPRRS